MALLIAEIIIKLKDLKLRLWNETVQNTWSN